MYFDFSNSLPNEIPSNSLLPLIDRMISKINIELENYWNGKEPTSMGLMALQTKLTNLLKKKQAEEVKMLINLELRAYQGRLAMLDPTTA